MQIKFPATGYLQVKVIPKSPKTCVTELLGEDMYKIRIKAAPEKGKANDELIRFLSKELNLPRSAFQIISGKTDRVKLIKIAQ